LVLSFYAELLSSDYSLRRGNAIDVYRLNIRARQDRTSAPLRVAGLGNPALFGVRETQFCQRGLSVSNPDSFIDEVTEELRRDRVAGFLRRYGVLIALAVVLLVGGAAWNEWRKATAQATAQSFGDTVLAALDLDTVQERAAALEQVETTGAQGGLLYLMRAAQLFETDRPGALAALQTASQDAELPDAYRQLAALKHVIAAGADLPAAERRDALDRLAQPGQPFRLLALEQTALLELELGNRDAAMGILADLLTQADVTDALRRRVMQLNVALGGTPDAN